MGITIRAVDDGAELEQLYHWLRQDVDVSRSAKVGIRASGAPGQMGALDVIDFALSNSTAVAAFVVAYASWRRSRSGMSRLTVTNEDRSITVEGCSDEEIRRIIELLSTSDGPDRSRNATEDDGRMDEDD